ncbi:MAG: LacI family DNA-binding transcriptional regulator [Eubacterium sp.]|nr:LacI family DNA-binding transcriptional regulator [Eubacterium sp.]
MATIKDISRKCGVSPATVSKALNGYPDISQKTAEMIRRVATEMNYTPDAAARLLKTNISHDIGVLFVDEHASGLKNEYFSRILNSAKEEAESLGYDITFISQYVGGRSVSFLEHCKYRRCDGVVIACVNFDDESVRELIQSGVPAVTIDYTLDGGSSVQSDNETGVYTLASRLIELGHDRIAFIHGENAQVTDKRLAGYRKALKDHNIPVRSEYIIQGKYHDPESSKGATAELLAMTEPPTAIMYPDDYSALGGYNEITSRGLSIPEDISVTGYDGISLSEVIKPQLTTWRQNTDGIGRESIRRLVSMIEKGETYSSDEISISGRLLDGYSVKDRRSQL